jgi:hypothetical protein
LDGSQITVSGEFLIEAPASPAVNAAIHFVLDESAQVLIMVRALFPRKTPDPMAAGNRHILKQAMAAFVTNGTIVRMVHHEPFNDLPAEADSFFIPGGYHHAILCIHHAAHFYPFNRAFHEFDRTHPAGADRSEARVIAKSRNDNAKSLSRLNDLRPGWNIYFITINLQSGHVLSTYCLPGKCQGVKLNIHMEAERENSDLPKWRVYMIWNVSLSLDLTP